MRKVQSITVAVLLALAVVPPPAIGQDLQTTTTDGGSVVTDLGYSIKINEKSSLRRTLVVINDPSCPLQLSEAGINIEYNDRSYSYRPTGTATAQGALSAIEVRYLLFDMFGNHFKTLSATKAADLGSGSALQLKEIGSWRAWENEVSELLTIVAFVGHVRDSDGSVWRHRADPINDELNKIRLRVTTGDLDPTKDAR